MKYTYANLLKVATLKFSLCMVFSRDVFKLCLSIHFFYKMPNKYFKPKRQVKII